MSDLLDGDLSATDEARLLRHVDACRRCAQVLAQLRATLDRLGALRQQAPRIEPSVADAVIARLANNAAPGDGARS